MCDHLYVVIISSSNAMKLKMHLKYKESLRCTETDQKHKQIGNGFTLLDYTAATISLQSFCSICRFSIVQRVHFTPCECIQTLVWWFLLSFNLHGMPNQFATGISYCQLAQPNLMPKEKIHPLDSKRKCHQVSDR